MTDGNLFTFYCKPANRLIRLYFYRVLEIIYKILIIMFILIGNANWLEEKFNSF